LVLSWVALKKGVDGVCAKVIKVVP
jgi:hypothetical protein